MNEQEFKRQLTEIEEQRIPGDFDLWQGVKAGTVRISRRRQARQKICQMVITLMVFSLFLIALFPKPREVAAKTIREIIMMTVGMFGDSKGVSSISPPSSYEILLPGYIPEDFEYVSSQVIFESDNLPSIQVERVQPDGSPVEPGRLPGDYPAKASQPSIVVRYQDSAGQYIELLERKALPEEALPAGEPLAIRGNAAQLQRDGEKITLTWVEAQTWVQISSILPETELHKFAESLVMASQNKEGDHLNLSPQNKVNIPCDPSQVAPENQPLLGSVSGQRLKGNAWIHFFAQGEYPVAENISYGSNVPNLRDEVLKPALQALLDPALSVQPLPYANIGMTTWSEERQCLVPVDVQGYLVIEVWDQQVNVGYGGDGRARISRAVEALEREISNLQE